MPDVFISYKREERDRCLEIHDRLVALRLDVWFDARLESGTRFDDEIESAVRDARCVLVLWSPAAARSEWIRNEAMAGKERDVIASAFVAPTKLPIAFLSTQTEDLTPQGFAHDWNGWLSTLRRIGSLTGRRGLEEYSRLLAAPDAEGFKRWAAKWPEDPLAEEAWQRAEAMELVATRERLARERSGAMRTSGAEDVRNAHAPAASQPASLPARVTGSRNRATLLVVAACGIAGLAWFFLAGEETAPTSAPPEWAPPTQASAPATATQATAPQTGPAPAQAQVPGPDSGRAAGEDEARVAAAGTAIEAITLREWATEPVDSLIERATRVAPFEAIRILSERGNPKARALLGLATAFGLNGVERSEAAAVPLLRAAADQGVAAAQVHLGWMHEAGRGGLPVNEREAVRLYRLAAAQGHAIGQSNLGAMFMNGRGGLPQNDSEAVRLFELAVGQGSPFGMVKLGLMFEAGRGGLPKDEGKAANLYRQAAELGNPLGQYYLGLSRELGRAGLAKDDREAVKLYRLSAAQGEPAAQSRLGVMYLEARGGLVQNDAEAARLFGLAAEQGDAVAQMYLGWMREFARGGLQKDLAEAVRLYRLAARGGNDWAQDRLRALGEAW